MGPTRRFGVGDRVSKRRGDYTFAGTVVAAFAKLSGGARYVVENGDGLLHVFSEADLAPGPAARPGASADPSGS